MRFAKIFSCLIFLEAARSKFTPAEDRLLTLGIKRFGIYSWDAVQARFLPAKTVNQIFARYKNLTTTAAPDNPTKVFH